ncbi:diguanylate cyclase/phosphodiesterase [Psychromonas ingrahamii 37]|uniref:Diguanylate cyclase/phosphodiesterase n=1 Tax=Psychromonas ingrahamii (strain DSM 17664 / CCUG 51855 / 37) TaxID=357804 RepID=A1SSH8_PSYIN|nr:EAL domain-containing protein [Psychromonas ingrahamii]ABM02443.1 diguanylate cyclase/phosphodiesterase [Psychromonas ingrahamii 37]
MNMTRFFEWIEQYQLKIKILMIPLLAILIVSVYILVYMTGGIKFVYSHSMYVPIVLSGLVFGARGGILVGLISGLVLGPFMPIDVVTGEQQKMINWLYRTGFFTLIAFISGIAWDGVKTHIIQLNWILQHNASTRLPNQLALLKKIPLIVKEKSSHCTLILAVISLENSMELKNAFGLGVIQEIIQQLAKRLKDIEIKNYTYQIETSQLVILAVDSAQKNEAIYHEIAGISREPFTFNEIFIHVDIRMGISEFSQLVQAPIIYLQEAVRALAVAQERKIDRVTYSAEIKLHDTGNVAFLGELKKAIAEGELSMHYQPKIDIPTGNIHSVEALMRWNHPEKGNIPPCLFIPRAEQSTLINLLTEFALDEAIKQIVQWRQYDINIPVAVNISINDLLHPGFYNLIANLLDKYGVSGEFLELELTEGVMIIDMEKSNAELMKLKKLNISFSIDDFGTGYSSLQYLHLLPISFIKIDQSFVRRLPSERHGVSIVEATVMLANKMGIKAIAEGVENKESYDFLENIGCDIAQGYLISRPLPADDFTKFYLQCGGRYLPA